MMLERHVFLVWLWNVLRWLGYVSFRLGSFGCRSLWVSLLFVSPPCVHKGDGVRMDGELRVGHATPVRPLGCRERAIDKDEPPLGQILGKSQVVLTAATHPYPCCRVLSVDVVIGGYIHGNECSP